MRLGQTWKIAAWEITHLGSCNKRKSPWEVASWEKSFGKVPNILKTRARHRSIKERQILKSLTNGNYRSRGEKQKIQKEQTDVLQNNGDNR